MKRVIIGAVLTIIGTIWGLAILIAAGNNLVSSWPTPPGRLLTTVSQLSMMPIFVLAIVLVVLGLVIMGIEYFRKDL